MGKVEKPGKQPAQMAPEASAAASHTASDSVIPSLHFLRASDTIQARVDDRIKELQAMHPQGKFKSHQGMCRLAPRCQLVHSWGYLNAGFPGFSL